MDGLTVHIPTGGKHTPLNNAGSNPLAQGSDYHLGPNLGIFGLALSPNTEPVNYDDLFDPLKNPLLVQVTNANLSVVHSVTSLAMNPLDTKLMIGGVAYMLPLSISRRIRIKNGGKVHWQTTLGHTGSFRFFRHAPAVF